jgi:hypothetical protein
MTLRLLAMYSAWIQISNTSIQITLQFNDMRRKYEYFNIPFAFDLANFQPICATQTSKVVERRAQCILHFVAPAANDVDTSMTIGPTTREQCDSHARL